MQKSTAVIVRAFVMLACLALLPLFALFGSSTPELFAKLLGREATSKVSSAKASLTEAPKFCSENTPPMVTSGADSSGNSVAPLACRPVPAKAIPAGYVAPIESSGPSAPVSQAYPYHSGDGRNTVPAVGNAPGPGFSERPMSGVVEPQVSPGQFSPTGVDRFPPIGTPEVGGLPPATPKGDTFIMIQERLRDLGAVYFRLESWGSGQAQFRFQCEMAVNGSPGLTRHFEAVNQNPLLAMRKVLVEAEAWQASR